MTAQMVLRTEFCGRIYIFELLTSNDNMHNIGL